MAHGGHGKHRVASKPTRNTSGGNKRLGVQHSSQIEKKKKKTKMASIKNQIRSIERLLKKSPSVEVQEAQNKRLEELKKQAEEHQRAEIERKMSVRYRRVKFFERRKIQRSINRLEKQQDAAADITDNTLFKQKLDITEQLVKLKDDLEYVRFFPKTEKYVSLFMGNDDEEVIAKRSKLREQIKANLATAAASGVEPEEEMDYVEDQAMEVNDDDFFLAGSSSDDAETDDKWTPASVKPGAARDHTSKRLATSSTRSHTLGHKNPQHHQSLQSSGFNSQVRNQKPQASGSIYKKKGSHFHEQMYQSTKGETKNKKQNSPPSRSLFPSNSRKLQSRSQPASNTTKIASAALAETTNNAGFSIVPSSHNSDNMKIPTILEDGSSNMDVHKKRRRKHRPKKKKA